MYSGIPEGCAACSILSQDDWVDHDRDLFLIELDYLINQKLFFCHVLGRK